MSREDKIIEEIALAFDLANGNDLTVSTFLSSEETRHFFDEVNILRSCFICQFTLLFQKWDKEKEEQELRWKMLSHYGIRMTENLPINVSI
jgi:hypothetical protein